MMSTNSTINTGVNSLSTLKGIAKRTYNRVKAAMAEDKDASMCHTFAALTDGAKAKALQSGHFSNAYIRANAKCMDITAAAEELEAKASAKVERKLRKIDHIISVAFLAEYITRQREAVAKESTPETATAMNEDNTPEILSKLKRELQEYNDNASKGGVNRRRNMIMLRWDIRKLERKLNASTMRAKVKALMLSAGYVLANGSTLKEHTDDVELSRYLDGVAWVCLQNDKLSICRV